MKSVTYDGTANGTGTELVGTSQHSHGTFAFLVVPFGSAMVPQEVPLYVIDYKRKFR